jgi:uridylate kinase
MTTRPRYKRVLLKLSGEALMGSQKFGLDYSACSSIGEGIQEAVKLGVKLAIVVGGGNIFRGSQAKAFGFQRTPADQIGMLATVINGLALQQTLHNMGLDAHVMSAIPCGGIVENYGWLKANALLEKGAVPIFVGGTGNPYFTTDTAAALRASEIHADVLMKATKVEGVFDKDPFKAADAKQLKRLSYGQALADHLNVMDATALAMCRENKIPIYVFNAFRQGALIDGILDRGTGSLVTEE